MSKALGFVPQGYSDLNEVPGLHPRVEFTFVRMTNTEYAQHQHDCTNLNEVDVNRLLAAHLAGHISQWDLARPKSGTLELTPEALGTLTRLLFTKLWLIISGQGSPDALLEQTAGDAKAQLEAKIAAAANKRPLGAVLEEAQRKN